jgi:hypothetical protein
MRAIGIAIPFIRRSGAAIDAQAQAHFDRVIADGGLVPSGLSGVNAFFTTIKTIYATSDITTAISVGLDAQVLGYKLGAGAGTTLGQAAQKLYSCSGASGDVVQTTAASQPLLLVHSGANYLWSSGVTGNNCTTSTNSSFQVNGDFTIDFNVSDLVTSGEYICKGNSTDGFVIFLNAGAVRYTFFDTGVRTVDLTSQPINLVTQKWCRVQRSGFNYSWWTSTDGITFTQVGLNVVDIVVTKAITAPLRIGQGVNFYASPCVMKTYRARFYNDATQTTLISDFNPNQYNAANSQTQWVSTSGETWTINVGTAATGYKGVLVDRTIVQGDGVDDLLINAIVRPNILTQYLATNTYTNDNSGNAVLVDSNSGSYLNSIVAFTSIVGNIMNGFASDLTKAKSANVVYLVTTSNNSGVKNAISVNNGTETTNAYTPALSGNGISILSRSSGGTKANALIRTYLLSNAQDDSTVRTDMYNYIRSINNSAF